jgi:hypothetical protein
MCSSPLEGAEPIETAEGVLTLVHEDQQDFQEIKSRGERVRQEIANRAAAKGSVAAVKTVLAEVEGTFLSMCFASL